MENEGRLRTLKILRVLSVVHVISGLLLLVLVVVAQSTHGPVKADAPPYYVGAIITLVMPLVIAGLGVAMYVKGRRCQNRLEASRNVGCLMQSYCIASIVSLVLCVIGLILTGATGVCAEKGCSYGDDPEVNRGLAITILVFICACLVTSFADLVITCKTSQRFGVRLLTRGQYQVSTIDNPAEDAYTEPGRTVTPVVRQVQTPPPHHPSQDHADPRLASPPRDFSTHHLQHFLTEQYRTRIRKRRKRNRRKDRAAEQDLSNGNGNGHVSRRQRERQAPYVLPPVSTGPVQLTATRKPSKRRAPLPPSSPPPPPPMNMYPPPSPSPSPSSTPPTTPTQLPPPQQQSSQSSRPSEFPAVETLPNLPGAVTPPPLPTTRVYTPPPLPTIETQPPSSDAESPDPPKTSPRHLHPGIIHVIPCGSMTDDEDEELPSYSP